MYIDFKSERVRSVLRLVLYAIGGAVAAVVTIFIVFAAKGYDIDRSTGELIQNGLILVDAAPESAAIYVNGASENDSTPGKLALPAGDYHLELQREGYKKWAKSIELTGAQVVWVYYPKLFPEKPETVVQKTYGSVNDASQSLDKNWLLVRSSTDEPTYEEIEISKIENPARPVTLPPDIFTRIEGRIGALEIIEWSQNNKTIILKNTAQGVEEYIVFDRTKPQEARNITKEFGLPLRDVRFRGGSDKVLFALVEDSLRQLDLEQKTISSPLADKVFSFRVYGDKAVLIVQELPESGVIRAALVKDGKSLPIHDVAPSEKYFLRMEKYDGDEYLVVGDAPTSRIYVYKNPFNNQEEQTPKPYRTLQVDTPRMISFSDNAQFIAIQSQNKFSVYDIERDVTHSFELNQAIADGTLAKWMDGHRLMLRNKEGRLVIFEYDGANEVELITIHPEFDVFFDRAFEDLYTFAPTKENAQIDLQHTDLVVKQQ